MNATITRLGILRHQICYSVKLENGPSNCLKTLAAARKWAIKMGATTIDGRPIN